MLALTRPHRVSPKRPVFKFLLGSIAILCPVAVYAQTNVLFVGNSFTHGHSAPVITYNSAQVTDANGTGYGGIPGIFKKMTTQAGASYSVTIEAVSSQTLSYHLTNKSAIIGDPRWNVVVLQENSTLPLPTAHGGNPASFTNGADGLQDLILSNNPAARVILYETWTSPASATAQGYNGVLQAMQDDLQSAYYTVKYRSYRTTGKPDYSTVGRVGDAYMRAVNQGLADPDPSDGIAAGTFDLWDAGDHRHPSIYGSYLSAATFFQKITGLDPRTLATGAGSAAADLGISSIDAQNLLRIAYETNALTDPSPVVTPPANPVVNTLNAGTSLNWNASANWNGGALAATQAVLIDASSATISQVANSLDGASPHPASIHSVSFDIGTATKNVQPNLTTQNPRSMTLTGGTDALGGTDLLHVSSNSTGTANIGTNSGFSTLTINLGTAGNLDVENPAGTLNLGASSILAGNVSVAKTGLGQLVLAGANTLGATAGNVFTVAEGTLLANTAVSGTNSATGAAGVSVLSAAILGGTGQITPGAGKQIVIADGGVIAPGAGLGTLTINGANTTTAVLVLMPGAQLNYELNSSGPANFQSDKITLLNGAANDISFSANTFNFNDLSSGALPPGAYTLFSAAAVNNYSGLAVDSNGFVTAGPTIGTGLEGYSANLQVVGANLVLNVAPTPYTAWKAKVFSRAERQDTTVSGDLATPAQDGVVNLLKYALNIDPHLSAASALPIITTETASGATYVTLTYTRVMANTDINYVAEVSPDLLTWNSGSAYTTVENVVTSTDGSMQTVRVRALDPQQHFARLRVSRN